MSSTDARFLAPDAQEALRTRVMAALRGGMKPPWPPARSGSRAAAYGTGAAASRWATFTSLRSKKRGRPKGTQLAPHEAATTVRLITDRCPDQLKLPFALWTREAVQQLLGQRFGVQVSVRTVGRYLAGWG